jgi:hypothetical protein
LLRSPLSFLAHDADSDLSQFAFSDP